MVRVNIIPPTDLTDQHLIAERLEILMIAGLYVRTRQSKSGFQQVRVPDAYTLGAGHAYFFFDKPRYLAERFNALSEEGKSRGFNMADKQFPLHFWDGHPGTLRDWVPAEADFKIIRARISERIALKPDWYRHNGKRINMA